MLKKSVVGIGTIASIITIVTWLNADPRACVVSDYRMIGFGETVTTHGDSGWRSGYSKDQFCKDTLNNYLSTHGIGREYRLVQMIPAEESRSGYFNTNFEYRYACAVTLEISPQYRKKPGIDCI